MKTPREILLERHRAAATQLDVLATRALATTRPADAPASSRSPASSSSRSWSTALALKLWVELIYPSRRTWGTLAAVWLVLAVVHFTDKNSGGFSGLAVGIPSRAALASLEEPQILPPYLSLLNPPPSSIPPPTAPPARPDKSSMDALPSRDLWS